MEDYKYCHFFHFVIDHRGKTSVLLVNCRLIKLGLDVNRRHELGWTALQVAVINKNVEYVRLPFTAVSVEPCNP